MPLRCEVCGASRLRPMGTGSQRIQRLASDIWPQADVLRLDSDVAAGRGQLAEVLRRFSTARPHILVATRMVAPSLPWLGADLIGLVDADQPLRLANYRSAEQAFEAISRMAGSALGVAVQVVVQSYNPNHPAIAKAVAGDYEGFASAELEGRRLLGFPPYVEMAVASCTDADDARALGAAGELGQALRSAAGELGSGDLEVQGPYEARPSRSRGKACWQLTLKGHGLARLRPYLPQAHFWSIDVDPR